MEERIHYTLGEIIQEEASRQEKVIKKEDPELEVVTIYGELEKRGFAVIASSKWIDFNALASYDFPPIGILGRLERVKGNVAFIAPFWIWHDGW